MRLPETSVSLPDITLSDERCQGERARTAVRYGLCNDGAGRGDTPRTGYLADYTSTRAAAGDGT